MKDIMNSSISPYAPNELVNVDSLVAGINTSRSQRFKHIYAVLDTAWRSWDASQEVRCAPVM
jgi:hypothetical protein